MQCVILYLNSFDNGLCSKHRDKLYSVQSTIYIILFYYIYCNYYTTRIHKGFSCILGSYLCFIRSFAAIKTPILALTFQTFFVSATSPNTWPSLIYIETPSPLKPPESKMNFGDGEFSVPSNLILVAIDRPFMQVWGRATQLPGKEFEHRAKQYTLGRLFSFALITDGVYVRNNFCNLY